MTDENARDMSQVRHSLEKREFPSSQYAAETQASSVRIVTPLYKLSEKTPNTEVHMGGAHSGSEYIASMNGDYKAQRSAEQLRMQIIDPKVNTNAFIPSQHGSLPNYGKKIVEDFPSQHGKRSLLKLDPLEQRRIRSVESRPITTSTYLTESLDRHREMEASKLRQFLKASEDDANKPWNKPAWPGPKANDGNDESSRQLEEIRKRIESLQKRSMSRSQSMGELRMAPPIHNKFKSPQSETKPPPTNEDGWLVKIRTHRYLENAKNRMPSRTRSVGDLSRTPKLSFASDRIQVSQTMQKVDENESPSYKNGHHPSKGGDELSWQLKKEFHLSKYTERRRSSFISETQHQQHSLSSSSHHQEYDSSRYQTETPLSRQKRSNSQLLYPPGSTDQIASEHTPQQRLPEKVVYENRPYPPAVVSLNISQASNSSHQNRLQGRFDRASQPLPTRQPEDDYSERLMSPPPGRQTPKSILKQNYSHQQHYSDQEQSWEQGTHITRQQQTPNMSSEQPQQQPSQSSGVGIDPSNRRTPANYGSTFELDEPEKFRIMQESLRKHREHRSYTPQNVPRYPTTSFNGPFFKLEEVTASHSNNGGDRPRSQSVAPVMNQTSERQRYEEEMHFQEQYNQYHYQEQQQQQHQQQQMNRMKNISASEMELNRHHENAQTGDDGVVIWPPPPHKSTDRPRPASAMARSILDPERIEEFRKQKHREMEAMRRREEREGFLHHRQLQAMQVQQQRLYEQRQQLINEQPPSQRHSHPQQSQQPQQIPMLHNIPQINTLSPTDEIIENTIPQYAEDPGPPPPSNMRIFETRPISAMSGEFDPRETMSPSTLNTWRRTYMVDKPPGVAAKNEILTSEELLEKERIEVDLLKRREAFIEKPDEEPEIFRTGKRWQPPPEKPYIWPTLRRPVTVEPGNEPIVNFAPGVPDEGEYRWQPIVYDPKYKKERKNFTPTNSPPHSPRRGMGTGPLDDAAKRQTKYVIHPSPDGSHRPRAAFKQARQTPSGGFLPHAPNAVKIIKKRSTQIHNSLSPNFIDQGGEEVEVIHEKNFHRLDDPSYRQQTPSQSRSRSLNPHNKTPINDWEKIYDLPPHSSTITNRDPPPNIDVRRRLQLFESQVQSQASTMQRRAYSERRNSESPQTTASTPKPSQQQHHESSRRTATNTPHHHHRSAPPSNGGTLLRRVDSRGEAQQHHLHHQHQQHHSQQQQQQHRQRPIPRERTMTSSSAGGGEPYSSKHASRSGTPQHQQKQQHAPYSQQQQSSSSAMPQQSAQSSAAHRHHDDPSSLHHQQRPTSSTSQRRLQRIIQAIQPSPAPPSYERARPYVPPPLPPGYKAAQEPKKHDDLDELARKNQELAERSKNRRHDYKLVGSDIIKTDPEPLPTHFKEQIREMLESRISTDTSSFNQQDRSGYVTDASSATWQFNNSFSPRSVVSLNGAKAEDANGLLKVRTTTAPPENEKKEEKIWPFIPHEICNTPPDSAQTTMTREFSLQSKRRQHHHEHYGSMPTMEIWEDITPRSIMKRSQLDSREQMTYAEPERRIVREQHHFVQAKPKVTETIQRVEENKRTEEVERRVIRRERRQKSSRHRSGHGYGGHQEYVEWHGGHGGQGEQQQNRGILQDTNHKSTLDKSAFNYYKMENNEAYQRLRKRLAQGSQTQQMQQQPQQQQRQGEVILQKYNGRRYTADELNQAVKRAYQAVDKAYTDIRQWRSNSMQRGGGHSGYLPAYESYNRSSSTRRDRERENFGDFSNRFNDNRSGLAHARYGSLSDSLRRGELKYVPNGDFRENYNRTGRMHKSHSTRDVFHDGGREHSWRRGSAGPAPFIEFPPTLPRSARGEPPMPPPHRGFSENNSVYRPISKSRSYADWDEGRGPFGSSVKRYDDDMARLENEFRDSLLMRLPNGNMNEKDYRQEQIPGGHETYSRESKANGGRRLNREGVPTDFKEASQEYSFKREVAH